MYTGTRGGGGGGCTSFWFTVSDKDCKTWASTFNSLTLFSPNSDQHQISPCNINAYLTPEVMRIKNMITQGEFS